MPALRGADEGVEPVGVHDGVDALGAREPPVVGEGLHVGRVVSGPFWLALSNRSWPKNGISCSRWASL
jgi:hypothetical protein